MWVFITTVMVTIIREMPDRIYSDNVVYFCFCGQFLSVIMCLNGL